MPIIDLAFDLKGESIPLDYGYGLYSALCRIVPGLHGDGRIGVHPVRGVRLKPRRLTLVPQSRLRLRLPSDEIAAYLSFAGAQIDLEGDRLSVGIPRVEPLRSVPNLAARLVTIGRLKEPAAVEASLRRQLDRLGATGDLSFIPSDHPDHLGEAARRVLRIKGKRIVGYPVRISGLTATESLLVQEHGLGSRRRMGCGIFVPYVERKSL